MEFKNNFAWGAATASYQIEGAWNEDGRGLSVWDQMVSWPGKIVSGDSGNIACDHYHRYREDVSLMKDIGINAYRFSISWPRVIPGGRGPVNAAGLDFYDRLVDELLAAGITPWATLFHWDFPLELYYRGGWLNPDSSLWFAEYAAEVAGRLGDRVGKWFTLNEPDMFVTLGHSMGIHAPGLKLDAPDIVRIVHNALMAHHRGAAAIAGAAAGEAAFGMAPALSVIEPGDPSDPALVDAARDAQYVLADRSNFSFSSCIWNDAAVLGEYPGDFMRDFGRWLPAGAAEELKSVFRRPDFMGLNIYQSQGRSIRREDGSIGIIGSDEYGEGYPRTNFMWPVTPAALYWGPKFMYERYGLPIVITENGMSSHDWPQLDGSVRDSSRQDYMRRYLANLRRAAADGVDVDGYFHWSLMDNFEWAEGYRHRFGLIHVDFSTGERRLKDSAAVYRSIIESNGESLAGI